MSTLKELLSEINEKRIKLDEELKLISGQFFSEQSKALFEQFPTLKSFSWTQYTPYFNDGDECTFGANTDYPTVRLEAVKPTEDEDEFTDEFEDEDDDYVSIYNVEKTADGKYIDKYSASGEEITDQKKIITYEVAQFLQEFQDDAMKMMFGDHVRVTVYRDGSVLQDEYEHE